MGLLDSLFGWTPNPWTGKPEPDPAAMVAQAPQPQPQPSGGLLAGQQPQPQQQGGFDFQKGGDAIGGIYGRGGPGDALIALGAGLMSKKGVGEGLQAGLQTMQSQQLIGQQRELMKARAAKLLQDQQTRTQELTGRLGALKGMRPGMPDEEARAVAGNDALFNEIYRQGHPSETFSQSTDPQGNVWQTNAITGQRQLLQQPRQEPATPASIQEFEYAKKGGFTGTFPEFKALNQKPAGELMSDETAGFMADRVLAGDNRALVGLGRGAQGAENIAKIQGMVAQRAREQGLDPSDLLQKSAEAAGMGATQRTLGTQTARMATASTEAEGALRLGREASALVPRGTWVPVTKAIQAWQSGTSDPALAKFGAANMTIINTYARAINPQGVPHASDKDHASQLLSTAVGPEAYNAVLDQLQAEIDLAHQAPAKAKKMLEDIRTGNKGGAAENAPATKLPSWRIVP